MKPPPPPRRQPGRPVPPRPLGSGQPSHADPQVASATPRLATEVTDDKQLGQQPQQGAPKAPKRISSRRIEGVGPTGHGVVQQNAASVLSSNEKTGIEPHREPSGRNPIVRTDGSARGPLGDRVPVLSSGMADRLAERAAITKRLRIRKLRWILSVVVGLVGIVWLIWFSPILALDPQEIKIAGTGKYVSQDDVLEALAPLTGTPLARVSMTTVHESIANVKNVREVVQTRRWPKGLTVTVEERVPVAGVPQDNGFALLDIDGEIVARQDQAPPELPIIELTLSKGTETTLKSVLGILEYLPGDLLADIESIAATSQDSVNLKLRDGITVHWGSSDETALKLEVLQVLRGTAVEQGVKVIDLSAPTFPITR